MFFSNIILTATILFSSAAKSIHVFASSELKPPTSHSTHVLREKTNLGNAFHGGKYVPHVSRIDKRISHTVIFAIEQSNMDELTKVLHDVSDPTSLNYGKFWSKQKVGDFTFNKRSHEATLKYLRSRKGIKIEHETLHGEYIFATAPIHVWEDVFATTFASYAIAGENHHYQSLIRAEAYSIPIELDKHVSAVFNTVQFPPPNLLKSFVEIEQSEIPAAIDGLIYGYVTPELINKFYHVINNTITGAGTQAVYESLNQSYSPSDLLKFQKYFNLTVHGVSEDIGGHAFNNSCVSDGGNNCLEANLDVQYLMGIAEGVKTVYYYSEDWILSWITTVADSANPSDVYSISYTSYELGFSMSYLNSFNNEAIKLGTMGTTILSSSGDDGVAGYLVRDNSTYCGYNPQFPSSSPYVVSVGGTNVR